VVVQYYSFIAVIATPYLVLGDLIHISITSGSRRRCRRSSSVGVGVRGRSDKIIGHLRVEFLLSLLRGTAVATPALLVTSGLSSTLGGAGVVLVGSSGLGLSLGLGLRLSSTFGKSLGSRDNLISLSGSNNDLDLDRSVVN
jgi:hypothetical protein